MKYNRLGNSELNVSAVGFGAMSLDLQHNNEAEKLLQHAVDCGITFFDTADLYDKGLNEICVGKGLKYKRKDIMLATKVGNKWNADGAGWTWDVSPGYIRKALEDSLRRLQTDYIDLYQIHGGTHEDDAAAVVSLMEEFVSEGKIRYYGISSIRPNVFTKYANMSNAVSNMMQYSMLDTRAEEYMGVLAEANMSIIARGVLAQGILINKNPRPYLDFTVEEVSQLQQQLKAGAAHYNMSTAALALHYVLEKPIVASALVGVRTIAQLDTLLAAYIEVQKQPIEVDHFAEKKIYYKDHLL